VAKPDASLGLRTYFAMKPRLPSYCFAVVGYSIASYRMGSAVVSMAAIRIAKAAIDS